MAHREQRTWNELARGGLSLVLALLGAISIQVNGPVFIGTSLGKTQPLGFELTAALDTCSAPPQDQVDQQAGMEEGFRQPSFQPPSLTYLLLIDFER